MDAAVRGEAEALVAVYEAFADPVYAYALRQLRSPQLAEDLAGDVFLEVVRNIGRFEGGPSGLKAWIFRIAHNSLVDHFRAAARRPVVAADLEEAAGVLPDTGAAPEDTALGHVERDRILEEIGRLPDEQRQVVLLRLVADLSIAETAAIVSKSAGAVKALQHRAMRTLAARLGQAAG